MASATDGSYRAEQELDLRRFVDAIPALSWSSRPDGSVEFINQRWREYTGLSADELFRSGWKATVHPEDLALYQKWESSSDLKPSGCEVRLRRSDGLFRWFVLQREPLTSEAGVLVRWCGIATDIHDRKRTEWLHLAEMRTLQMITESASLTDILDHICSSVDLQISPSITTILLMDQDGKKLWPSAGPRVPVDWARAITPLAVAADTGLCATAAFLKTRVIVSDVATEPIFAEEYRDVALQNGIRAGWSQPILTKDNQVLGTFAIYSAQSRVPTAEDLALIEAAGRIALIAIERQRAQEALRKALDEITNSETKLRQVIDTIPTLAWSILPDGSNEFLNKRWHEYTGLSPEESHGSGWQVAIHTEDRALLLEKWQVLLSSGEPGEMEARLCRYDGVFRWFLMRVEPLRDETGKIVKWYGTCTDIETLKETEAKLREDEHELRRITDVITQAIVVQDPSGAPIYANQTTLDYTGLKTEDVIAPLFRERIFHPDDLERLREVRKAALAHGVPFEIEQRARPKDGQYRWFLIRYNPFRNDLGRVTRWYATGTDIDDRVRAEERTRNENLALREQIDRDSMFEDIVGSSEALRRLLRQIAKLASSDSTVLILGETGTGKELIARAIHKRSNRAERAFFGVNCAAIPASLIASELFGHERGAFTGATQRRLGRFESANGGTIFLDEVGDLPPEIQIALLRVLQEREIERVGSNKAIPVDVRVLAATHHDLDTLVAEGKFRRDLLYRLSVVPIQMPSLRERKDDIPLLVDYFVGRFGKKAGKKFRTIEKKTVELFESYEWPGNVRELQNLIERTVILSDGDIFCVDETWLKRQAPQFAGPAVALNSALQRQEKEMIEAALAEARGRVSRPDGAATKLGLPRPTLDAKIKRLGIDKYRFKVQRSS